jgi:nucleoside phosphorylase/tetratricopeptide (TPR) repeat protein
MPSVLPTSRFVHPLLRARDWQNRIEFEQLCKWWQEGGNGVCALLGIGGAGKTAIAERFIRILPGVTAPDQALPKNQDMHQPEGLFVFSFYDLPDPDVFFDELYNWLVTDFKLTDLRNIDPEGNRIPASAILVVEGLTRLSHQILLVLDGTEMIQDDGSRSGILGHIEHAGILEMLKRTAAGLIPSLGILMTTRFPLDDLELEREKGQVSNFTPISVDQLTDDACVALLRHRGVRGSDHDLKRVSIECGNHALTVDLAGGYLVYFRSSDPTANLDLSLPLKPDKAIERKHRHVLQVVEQQATKLNRLATRYHDALAVADKAALALLQRLCLFRTGMNVETLSRLFTGPGKNLISGKALASLNQIELQSKLDFLHDLRLVEESRWIAFQQKFSGYLVHPAIRTNFLNTLGEGSISRGHEAASRELKDTLKDIPKVQISIQNPRVLDLVEEIIYHTVKCGEVEAAWDILWTRLGGYCFIGWSQAAYQRGFRLCRSFFTGRFPPHKSSMPSLKKDNQSKLLLMTGLFLKDLGHLQDAIACFNQQVWLRTAMSQLDNACTGIQNIAEILLLQGRLRAASSASQKALKLANSCNDQYGRWGSSIFKGHTAVLLGNLEEANDCFQKALHSQHSAEKRIRPLYSLSGIYQAMMYLRMGDNIKAAQIAKSSNEISHSVAKSKQHMFFPHHRLVQAEVARQDRKQALARELVHEALVWAIAHDATESICWAHLVNAKVEIDELQNKTTNSTHPRSGRYWEEARNSIDQGLAIARNCGYGIYHIDLLLESARLHLLCGDPESALIDVQVALDEGFHPTSVSPFPELLSATDPKCGYAWGTAEGCHLRAQAFLLQAAQSLSRADFASKNLNDLPNDVSSLIKSAHQELKRCTELRLRIQDPKIKDTKQILGDLKNSVLTRFPITNQTVCSMRKISQKKEGELSMRAEPIHISKIKGHIHAAIITIRQDEYDAIESRLGESVPVIGGNNNYETASLQSDNHESVSVVLTRCVRQGNINAQAVANNIIQDIDPSWLLLVGIAGGVPDNEYSLGDVILASALHDFSFGAAKEGARLTYQTSGGAMHQEVEKFLQTKIGGRNRERLVHLAGLSTNEKFLSHPNVFSQHLTEETAFYGDTEFREDVKRKVARRFPDWKRRGSPLIYSGPYANANLLLGDSELLKGWRKSARQIVAIETELAGVYEAARTAGRRNYPILAIRGLSDIVGLMRDADWTQYACETAAAVTYAILRSGFINFSENLPNFN